MKRIGLLLTLLASLGVASTACRDRNSVARSDQGAVGTAGDRGVSMGDKNFVKDFAIVNMAEVELGRLAADHAASADVKKFGQMMVDDHTMAGDKLKAIATEHNIDWPAGVDDKHRDLRDKLSKLQGADFDREYMDAMVDGHQDAIGRLDSRVDHPRPAGTTSTPADRTAVTPEKSDDLVTMALNRWAADAYPTVQQHLDRAKMLKDEVKGEAKGAKK